ncbi:hypothetical protein E2C01_009406 [Portunus trituberculatus]|uniref:Uncharacterized protein n=1 Tax=Portunus trituberculatus TaxID=210409 RepID=A0A5B7D3F9_PORTR|nr:hypothetical protein [Portunus trituberculatus]
MRARREAAASVDSGRTGGQGKPGRLVPTPACGEAVKPPVRSLPACFAPRHAGKRLSGPFIGCLGDHARWQAGRRAGGVMPRRDRGQTDRN